jgi:4-hydroxymandelate oxidase
MSIARRQALSVFGGVLRARAQTAPVRPGPRADLVNVLEFEEQAKLRVPPAVFARIAGSERAPFERITLRPRMCVPVLDMNLSLALFGDTHFAPILVGPVENQSRFHADGERATLAGAAAANATVVLSSSSSVPLEQLPLRGQTRWWYQVFANDTAAGSRIQSAVRAGCRVICVTVDPSRDEWNAVASLARISAVPVVVKGVNTPSSAAKAIARGARGIIVSSYTGRAGGFGESPVLKISEIVDSAGGAPVLADGSFRRGTDVLKALASGACAVLVARPVMWGLAAYGADGVQGVVEMLQTELARYMGMCGKSRLSDLDRSVLKVHRL